MSDTFDFQLNYTEPATATPDHWELVEAPKGWEFEQVRYRDIASGVIVTLYTDGGFDMYNPDNYMPFSLIDRMQSLKALARKHFGEDWGEDA